MITKEEFQKAIEALRQQNAVDDNFQTHMEAAFPGSYAPIYENLLWTLSVHLLELLMEDPYKYIGWWVWETHFGKEHPNVTWTSPDGETEKVWVLDTPENLYDFLVENAKRDSSGENRTKTTSS